ncbi:predicted protein [Arabidopsis lyrata subsp. lyrata]|uniref:Predicted protein n=1 Tax=Arabidopsis lyrata subsp. lyrata TaxID=81972 RepID=D7MNT8_ARALL|nr:predicted protein [Arabidopsis lyrata subsp. lyrata]
MYDDKSSFSSAKERCMMTSSSLRESSIPFSSVFTERCSTSCYCFHLPALNTRTLLISLTVLSSCISICSGLEDAVGFVSSFSAFDGRWPPDLFRLILCLYLGANLLGIKQKVSKIYSFNTPSSLYHRRRELIDLQRPTHLITNLSVESRIFSGVLRRSLPPCTTAKLSSASSAGSAASPKYRFSSFKSVAAICIIPPDLLPPFLQAVRRVPSQPRVRLDPTIWKAFLMLVLASPVSRCLCFVSKNLCRLRDETLNVVGRLLRPVAFGCNKSVFKFGKMNQGGQGMIGILTLELSFPDSINSSLEERHGFNFLFDERETSSASISHRRVTMELGILEKDSPPHLRESFLRGGTPYQ